MLIAGDLTHVDDVAKVLRREKWLGYEVVGALTPGHHREGETALGVPVLGDSADVEIVERHHHLKKDAPSGTALRLAEEVGRSIGSGPDRYAHGREGVVGERPRGEIGLHALRTGDNPGEHTVVFGLMGECLELSHRALNRDGFARGALDAARFLAGKPPRVYTMSDLIA